MLAGDNVGGGISMGARALNRGIWKGLLLLGALCLTLACDDDCDSLPPTVQLVIRSGSGGGSIEVVLAIGGERRGRILNLEGALDDGSAINLLVIDQRVRFEVSLDATERAGLKVSSRMLAVALWVRPAR